MLEWSLACTQGACVSCRILHNSIYIRAHIWSWHLANARKKPHHVLDCYILDGRWMRNVSTSYLYDLISLHWFLFGNIFLVRDLYQFRGQPLHHWHLGVDICWMSPHTSSIWPWLDAPKVYLYNTFLSGLRHLPPPMKNQHGLNEEKNLTGKKIVSHFECLWCDTCGQFRY